MPLLFTCLAPGRLRLLCGIRFLDLDFLNVPQRTHLPSCIYSLELQNWWCPGLALSLLTSAVRVLRQYFQQVGWVRTAAGFCSFHESAAAFNSQYSLLLTKCKKLLHKESRPMPVYSQVRLIIVKGAYSQVSIHRIASKDSSMYSYPLDVCHYNTGHLKKRNTHFIVSNWLYRPVPFICGFVICRSDYLWVLNPGFRPTCILQMQRCSLAVPRMYMSGPKANFVICGFWHLQRFWELQYIWDFMYWEDLLDATFSKCFSQLTLHLKFWRRPDQNWWPWFTLHLPCWK